MFLADVNVWAALTIEQHEHHSAATDWFDSIGTPRSVRFCRVTQQGFLRLLTRQPVLERYGLQANTNRQAWTAFESLEADDRVGPLLDEPPDTERTWRTLSSRQTASPQLWTDAYLAAFAIAAKATLVTFDQAFTQFPGLDVHLID